MEGEIFIVNFPNETQSNSYETEILQTCYIIMFQPKSQALPKVQLTSCFRKLKSQKHIVCDI